MVKAADSKSGKVGQGGGMGQGGGQGQGQGQQKKELTEEDAKQMIKDLNDLKKLHQEFVKKMQEFQQKYGMMPNLGGPGQGGQGGGMGQGQGGGMGQGGQGGGMGQGGRQSKPSDEGGDFPQPTF
ncbi:MAG: hypothetical protein A2X48_23140 [Lentisphaerae bacterium GWF2_49_21]|nr:MAG: hypothetical protein A2X48_23140 [Lentisphaerae bacterium GWF2_49_21]